VNNGAKAKVERQLSPCETRILAYIADGYSNEEIAETLGNQCQTIKNHVSAILDKLQAKNRTHAVAIALKRGEIGSPDKEKTGIEENEQAAYQAGFLTCFCGENRWLMPNPGYLKCSNCGQVIMMPIRLKGEQI